MEGPTRLERRSRLLAQTMVDTNQHLATQLGAGERPSFTTPMTRSDSLAWWRQHIGDDYGRQALERMTPQQVMQLHLDLQDAMNAEMAPSGMPPEPPTGVPGA